MWGYLAQMNTNEIISWACPINWNVQPDSKNSKIYHNHINFPQLSLYDIELYSDDNFGKDRLGAKGMKDDDNESDSINPKPKGGSPLALEAKQVYLKNKSLIEGLVKRVSLETPKAEESLLDEKQIRE
jgi:hypothetical protein